MGTVKDTTFKRFSVSFAVVTSPEKGILAFSIEAFFFFSFSFSLPYKSFFGGVSALTPEHYMKMNGFPNTYWGSGGENDDIATRY